MKGFAKSILIFLYIFLVSFVQSNDIFAQENLTQCKSYVVSKSKPKTTLINNKTEEYYIVFDNRNHSELTKTSGKKRDLLFGDFDNVIFNSFVENNFKIQSDTLSGYITPNISSNLKDIIYTRAP